MKLRFILLIGLPSAAMLLASCLGTRPHVASIDPRIGVMGEVLTIRGTNFEDQRNENHVTIAGIAPTASSYIEWTRDRIAVRIPDFGDSGLVYVHVRGKKSNPALFTNRATMPQPVSLAAEGDGPRIESIDPAAGSIGSVLTITGKNFGASREKSGVQFAWDAQTPPAAVGIPSSVDVSEMEFAYELWSDREIRVRVPDGAFSGNLNIRTGRGVGMPVFFDVIKRPGTKTYKEKRSYAITYSVDIKTQKASGTNTLYVWMPRPVASASQRNVQLLSRSMDPFVEDHRGTALFQLKDLIAGSAATLSLSYLVDVYAVETGVKPGSIQNDGASAIRAAYTVATPLIPADDPEVEKLAARIVGKEKNSYLRARKLYDWLTTQAGIQPENQTGGALEALQAKKADAYAAAMLFCALARALEIPAIPVSGFLIDKNRASFRHFWAEFWIDGFGWVPVDPALGAGAGPRALPPRADATAYYFGNLDNQHLAFSRGQSVLSPMDPRGRVTVRNREYALQTLWEEALGGLESYSSLWSDLVVTGVY